MSNLSSKSDNNNLGKIARIGIAWTSYAQLAKHILEFAVGVIMARLLMPSDFGIIGSCMIFFSFISIFTSFGFSQAVIQRSSISEEYLGSAQAISIFIGLISTIVLASSAKIIGNIFHSASVSTVIPIISLNFVVSSFGLVPSALLTRKFEFDKLTISTIISSLTYAIVTISLAVAGFGIWSLVIGPLVSVLANVVLLSYFANYRPKLRLQLVDIKELLSFGCTVTAGSLLNHIARNADNFIIGRYLGAEPLGLYGRAYNLATVPKELVGSVLGSVLFPSFSRLQNDKIRLAAAYYKSVGAMVLVTLPVCVAISITAPELIHSVYGQKWSGSIVPLRFLGLAGFMYTLYTPCTSLILGLGNTRVYTILQIIYSFGIVSVVMLAFSSGINAIAVSVSIVITLVLIAYLTAVHKTIPLNKYSYYDCTKVALLGVIRMTIVIIFTRFTLYGVGLSSIYIFVVEILLAMLSYVYYILCSSDETCVEIRVLIQDKLNIISGYKR